MTKSERQSSTGEAASLDGMNDEGPEKKLAEGLALLEKEQARLEAKLQDPQMRRARDLLDQGEELFWRKQYDEGIQRIAEAAALDAEYLPRVEAYRKLKLRELQKGRVDLTRAIRRILLPRLSAVGIHPAGAGPRWKDGDTLEWTDGARRRGVVLVGRTKFGKQVGLSVARVQDEGEWEHLNLRTIGFAPDAFAYLNQEQANEALRRVAAAVEGPILAWLEGREVDA